MKSSVQATNSLKSRINKLELQYKSFVKYCIEMIQFHRSLVNNELKSDPNTPRDLYTSIILHSENLEKSVKLASDTLKPSSEKHEDLTLTTFKEKLQKLLHCKITETKKLKKFNTVFDELENYVSVVYTKKLFERKKNTRASSIIDKAEILKDRPSSVIERSGSVTERSSYNIERPSSIMERPGSVIEKQGFVRENSSSVQEQLYEKEQIIKKLSEKVKEKETQLAEKEEKMQDVFKQLEKIQNLQAASLKSFSSRYDSHRNSVHVSPGPYRIEVSSPDLFKYEVIGNQSCNPRNFIDKLQALKDSLMNIANQALKLNKSEFFDFNLEKLQFFIKESEKIVKEILTPCLETNKNFGKIQEKRELEKEIKELKLINKAKSGEIRNLHEVILGFKRNLNLLEKERNDMKSKKKFNENQGGLNRLKNNLSEHKLEIAKGGSFAIRPTNHNEILIRTLKKKVKELEKLCFDKESELKTVTIKKISYGKESQTDEFKMNPIENEETRVKSVKKRKNAEKVGKNQRFFQRTKIELGIIQEGGLQIISEKKHEDFEKIQQLEKKISDLNNSVNFYCKKIKLNENEKENLTSLLKSYEKCLSTKDEQILCLSQDSHKIRSLFEKVKDEKKVLESENFAIKKEVEMIKKCFTDQIFNFEADLRRIFELIYQTAESKLNGLNKTCSNLELLYKKQLHSTSQLQTSLEFLKTRLLDKEKCIVSLQNSLKLTESTLLSPLNKNQNKSQEKIQAQYKLLIAQLEAKNHELELLKHKKTDDLQSKIEENAKIIQSYSETIQKLQENEKFLNEKIELQELSLQNLRSEYESAKSDAEIYKNSFMQVKKLGNVKFLQAENKKLKEKNEDLKKKINKFEDLTGLKDFYQSELALLEQECKKLRDQCERLTISLKEEKQLNFDLKIQYEETLIKVNISD